MSNLADIDRLYDAVQQQHAQIDVIFANAGGGGFAPSARSARSTISRPSTPM
jgi:NAD(P)-dependent dehydrogenase (short-subunit alcohol dehydrogenase family)